LAAGSRALSEQHYGRPLVFSFLAGNKKPGLCRASLESHSTRIELPHLLRALESGSTLSPLNQTPEGVYGMEKGRKHAKQHDDEE
jgi:hypothetical protein